MEIPARKLSAVGDLRLFDTFIKEFKNATGVNNSKKIDHLESRHDALKLAVGEHIKEQFNIRVHKDITGASTFFSTSLATYCTNRGQVKEFLMKVIIFNMNYVGSRWGNLLASAVEYIATVVADSPDRSMGLLICPLVPARAADDDIDEMVNQIRAELKNDKYKLLARVVNLDADESSLPSYAREGTFKAIMIISDQTVSKVSEADPAKKIKVPVSMFTKSLLWTRRHTKTRFEMLNTALYVDPLTDHTDNLKIHEGRNYMGDEKRCKMLLTGTAFWQVVLESLFLGLKVEKSTHCALVDLSPYDGSLPKQAILHNVSNDICIPTCMVTAASWWEATQADKEAIKSFVISELTRALMTEAERDTIKYPELMSLSKEPPSMLNVPVLNEASYLHSKPCLEAVAATWRGARVLSLFIFTGLSPSLSLFSVKKCVAPCAPCQFGLQLRGGVLQNQTGVPQQVV